MLGGVVRMVWVEEMRFPKAERRGVVSFVRERWVWMERKEKERELRIGGFMLVHLWRDFIEYVVCEREWSICCPSSRTCWCTLLSTSMRFSECDSLLYVPKPIPRGPIKLNQNCDFTLGKDIQVNSLYSLGAY